MTKTLDVQVTNGSKTAQRNATLPAYHRLFVILSEGIRSGKYPPGELLPSENVLCKTYSMSRVTVRRALDQLVEDGLVAKHHGQGTIVKITPAEQNKNRVSGLLTDLVAQGIKFTTKTLQWGEVAANADVSSALGLRTGDRCLLIQRVRYHNKLPISVASIYLPTAIGKQLKRRNASSQLVIKMLEDTSAPAEQVAYKLSAGLADGQIADWLELPAGSPVLRMRGIASNRQGKSIYYQDSVYHPERYEYGFSLQRDAASDTMVWKPS